MSNATPPVTTPEALAAALLAAVKTAADKAGRADSVRALKIWAHTSVLDGKVYLTWCDACPATLRRVKTFAVAWLAKHCPELKTFHQSKGKYRVWCRYFDGSGVFDSYLCGIYWRVEVTAEARTNAILGRPTAA